MEILQNFVAFSECMNFITNHMYLSVVNFSVRVYKFRIIVNFAMRNLDRFDFEHWQIIEMFLTKTIIFRKGLVLLLNSVQALQLVKRLANWHIENSKRSLNQFSLYA